MQKAVTLSLLVSASLAAPQAAPAVFPATGENGQMGGIFGMGMPALNAEQLKNNQITKFGSAVFSYVGKPKADGKPGLLSSLGSYAGKVDPNVLLSKIVPQGPEYPQGKLTLADFYDPGSGKYPAHFVAEKTLANHTIYAPKNPPPSDVKMPVLIWGNGGCTAGGTSYATFLTEVASHGYLAIANGPPGSGPPSLSYPGSPQAAVPGPNGEAPDPNAVVFAGFSKIKDMTAAMDWVTAGNADKYGNIDKNSFITAGSSCGGLEAYSGAYHDDRVKLIGVFNSGVIDPKKKYLLKELKAKVALIQGGPKDIGFENSNSDFELLPADLGALKASLDSGHMGTFFGKRGGKYGVATVALFNWVFRNDAASKAMWTDPKSSGSLVSQNWNVTFRNMG